ncbi:hypothetical protein TBR22_A35540 [Luteitalea sp. TBR-22]|uniref:hypothetical protein n=1 Tax=Luteitalea sp. TBR-22 TaxID=2802971 RepID=UPI001AF93CF0|nr:hypothetical protein [Luteitalea sp. TBR-22]BCS34324.1 hypothetical protein TBR22_A35540 [Luteitalea sp. TBR-22]
MVAGLLGLAVLAAAPTRPAAQPPSHVRVAFDEPLRVWDGFGVNYVQSAQTPDPRTSPQDFGGASVLSEASRRELIDLVFGRDGLQPDLLKLWILPFHEPVNDNADPERTDAKRIDLSVGTEWMRWFAREGAAATRARGGALQILATLYGPPGWMTRQGTLRGRDLDPAMDLELAEYLAAYVGGLAKEEGLTVRWVSLHNEGEHAIRYAEAGEASGRLAGHDYNLFWTPAQVTRLLCTVRSYFDRHGLERVGLTPGETTYWTWLRPIAAAIVADPCAARSIGLVTSHGFDAGGDPTADWYAPLWAHADPRPLAWLRASRPDLHAWVTSARWGADVPAGGATTPRMAFDFLESIRRHVYEVGVNGYIPWAVVQRWSQWQTDGQVPNKGAGFLVGDDGRLTVQRGFHLYRHLTRAGRAGMRVARVASDDPWIIPFAFARGDAGVPSAFVLANASWYAVPLEVHVSGTDARRLVGRRTVTDLLPARHWVGPRPTPETWQPLPDVPVSAAGVATLTLPPMSVVTFWEAAGSLP